MGTSFTPNKHSTQNPVRVVRYHMGGCRARTLKSKNPFPLTLMPSCSLVEVGVSGLVDKKICIVSHPNFKRLRLKREARAVYNFTWQQAGYD